MEMGADVVKLNMPKLDPEKDKDSPAPYNEMEVTQEEAIRQMRRVGRPLAGRALGRLQGRRRDRAQPHPHDHGGRRLGRDLRPQRLAARVERGAGDHRADQGDAALQRAPHSRSGPGRDRARARRRCASSRGWVTDAGMRTDGAACWLLRGPARWSLRLSRCGEGASDGDGARREPGEHADRAGSSRSSTATRSRSAPAASDEDVRYIGIDTPETVKPGEPVECFGPRGAARSTSGWSAGGGDGSLRRRAARRLRAAARLRLRAGGGGPRCSSTRSWSAAAWRGR